MSQLPDGWVEVRIDHVADVSNGMTPSRGEPRYWVDGIHPWLPTSKVHERFILFADEFITQAALDECPIRIYPAGSVLVGMIGQGVTRGMAAYLTIDAAINQNFACIAPHNTSLDGLFAFYYMDSQYNQLRNISQGSNQGSLNCEIIGSFKIPLPPLPEQRKIAQILSTWDEAIQVVEAIIAALKGRKRGLMQSLIPNEHSLPPRWNFVRLSHFIAQYNEYVNKIESKLYPRISVKWWANGAVVAGYDHGDDVKMKRHQLAKAGQIIVSEIWAKHGSIGIIPEDGEGALITSHFYLFDLLNTAKHYEPYIHALVNSNYFMVQAERMSQGSTGYASIRAKDFLNFKLPVPPDGEEKIISDVLLTCDELTKNYEQYAAALREQKKGLMQRLLTGAVRVKGSSEADESEEWDA